MPVEIAARKRSYANLLGFKAKYSGDPARPANTLAPAVTGTPTVGQTLTTTTGTWTGNPTPTLLVEWLAGGVVIPGANATTYVLTPAEAGKVMTSRVLGQSIAGSAAKLSNATTAVAGALPVNTVAPAISGTAKVGETLTATDGTWTGTPTPELTRQWLADDEPIEGATEATFDLTEDEEGKVITIEVTGENLMGTASAASDATDAVIAAEE